LVALNSISQYATQLSHISILNYGTYFWKDSRPHGNITTLTWMTLHGYHALNVEQTNMTVLVPSLIYVIREVIRELEELQKIVS